MKVAIIGAGNVGGTAAQRIYEANLADVVLVDSLVGLAEAKVMDLSDAAAISGAKRAIHGMGCVSDIKGADIVVITAGLPRRPGMTREDLLAKNSAIIKEVVNNVVRHCPKAILVVVTNPLDVMTHLAYKHSGFPRERVIGMGGALDAARFAGIVANELKVGPDEVSTMVIGAHSDSMVPLPRFTRIKRRSLDKLLSADKIAGLVQETKERGSKIVGLFGGRGSAYYAPAAGIFSLVRAIISENKKEIVPATVYLDGEYGLKGLCLGVPVRLGRKGIREIVELDLNAAEKKLLQESAESVRKSLSLLV